MSGEHWRRDEFAFYNYRALDTAPLDEPFPLAGLSGALMSQDMRTGSRTYSVELPPGWTAGYDAAESTLELFVVRGDVGLDGASVGCAGYVHLPQGAGGGELHSTSGAAALAFWNPDLPRFPVPYTRNLVQDFWSLPWQPSVRDGSHGIMHKALRVPDEASGAYDGGPGGFLRIAFHAPGTAFRHEHVHEECWEEIVYLSGDMLLCDEGILGVGSVVSHPQEFWHGPFVSRGGAILLNHSDGPMGYPWPQREVPGQDEVCDAYLAAGAWGETAVHTAWDEVPTAILDAHDTPEYREWLASPGSGAYGDRVGRGTLASWRAAAAGRPA